MQRNFCFGVITAASVAGHPPRLHPVGGVRALRSAMQLREPRRDPRGIRAATSTITMPTTPTFDAISLTDLSAVTGGCGKKKCASCPPP